MLVRVVRDGVVESEHRGHVVVARPDGAVVAALGDQRYPTYLRSAAKPFQALAVFELLAEAGRKLPSRALAIACASHVGSATHQIEAAHLLALAGLEEGALGCPAALPDDLETLRAQREPARLAHNCSGKHAGFLAATTASGADPAAYLSLDDPVQVRVRTRLAQVTGEQPEGPGIDGCGAPAWVLALSGLAVGFAALAGDRHGLAPIAAAMRRHPDLVGGAATIDTQLMLADLRVVAKRGAEAVFAAGVSATGPLGVAVKIADGTSRAVGPVIAAVLGALGARVPSHLRAPPVLGGGRPHGSLEVSAAVTGLLA